MLLLYDVPLLCVVCVYVCRYARTQREPVETIQSKRPELRPPARGRYPACARRNSYIVYISLRYRPPSGPWSSPAEKKSRTQRLAPSRSPDPVREQQDRGRWDGAGLSGWGLGNAGRRTAAILCRRRRTGQAGGAVAASVKPTAVRPASVVGRRTAQPQFHESTSIGSVRMWPIRTVPRHRTRSFSTGSTRTVFIVTTKQRKPRRTHTQSAGQDNDDPPRCTHGEKTDGQTPRRRGRPMASAVCVGAGVGRANHIGRVAFYFFPLSLARAMLATGSLSESHPGEPASFVSAERHVFRTSDWACVGLAG